MATYLGFLRAINLGAKRKFPRADIVRAVEAAGFTEVETYINTGNVRFSTPERSRPRIEAALENAFRADRGFDVPVVVFTPTAVSEIVADAERFAAGHDGRHLVSLLKEEPTPDQLARMEALSNADEVARVRGRAVHLMGAGGYQTARLTNETVERILGLATNRNLTVLRAVTERWCP